MTTDWRAEALDTAFEVRRIVDKPATTGDPISVQDAFCLRRMVDRLIVASNVLRNTKTTEKQNDKEAVPE